MRIGVVWLIYFGNMVTCRFKSKDGYIRSKTVSVTKDMKNMAEEIKDKGFTVNVIVRR
jgi:hypothetical protein